MTTLEVRVVTPTQQVLTASAQRVSVPTTTGEITILPAHAALVATLAYGVLRLRGEGEPFDYFVAEGFVEVSATQVLVLAERADPLASLSRDRARASLADAEQRLKKIRAESAEYVIQDKRRRRAQARLLAIAGRDRT